MQITGTIVDVKDDKGFGFIDTEDARYFFHVKNVEGVASRIMEPARYGIIRGARVRFSPCCEPRRPHNRAVRIQIL